MKLKNDQGYALITVLLVTIILMIIGISALNVSFNTLKQNKVVENKSQSTSIAEMGISYYQAMINNIYLTGQPTVYTQLKSYSTLKTNDDYAQKAASLMMTTIQSTIDNQTAPVYVDKNSNSFFKLETPVTYDYVNNKITLKVDGVANNDTHTKLSTVITIATTATGASQTSGTTPLISITATVAGVLTGFNNITGIGILCTDPPTLDLNKITIIQNALCSLSPTAKITKTTPYNENLNNKKLSNKTYYATDNFTINGNVNHMEDVNIHSGNSLFITGNANSSKGGLIETIHNATFGQLSSGGNTTGGQLGLDASQMYIGGDLTVYDQFTISNNSTVYVNNTALISKNLTLQSNSTLCVGGLLTVNGQTKVDNTSRIILSGDADFQTKCKNPNTSTININWSQQLFSDTNYEY